MPVATTYRSFLWINKLFKYLHWCFSYLHKPRLIVNNLIAEFQPVIYETRMTARVHAHSGELVILRLGRYSSRTNIYRRRQPETFFPWYVLVVAFNRCSPGLTYQ